MWSKAVTERGVRVYVFLADRMGGKFGGGLSHVVLHRSEYARDLRPVVNG